MFGVIIGLDIKDYSQNEKANEMKEQRRKLIEIINNATKEIRIFNRKEILDTGDGCYILIDTGDYENILVGIENIQKEAEGITEICFRGIVHIGKYEKTENISNSNIPNFIGEGINTAARYLDAKCLKELLDKNDNHFVFGISSEFYQNLLSMDFFIPNNYRRYGFQVKKFTSLIYLNTNNINSLPELEMILKNKDFVINNDFQNILIASDFVYEVNGCNSNLNTFYVFPELRVDSPEQNEPKKILSDDMINKFIKNPFNLIISGGDQTGKTSLCKKYFNMIYESCEYVPLYLKIHFDEKGNINNKIIEALLKQYNKKSDGYFDNIILALIIDDFHLLNDEQQKMYIKYILDKKNCYAILFVDLLFLESFEKKKRTVTFKEYKIREFGHLKRNELIMKWINYIGSDNINYKRSDELSEYLDNTFIKGIIPYTPFYLLTVLATSENFVPLNGDLTSKGHCYQALIYISLKKMNISENLIGAFLNILSHIAFYLFQKKISSLSDEMLEDFFDHYSKTYNMPFERSFFIKKMEKSHLFFRNTINQFSFYAQYLYHYFVAKYMSENITDENVKHYIEYIYNNLDLQSNAYIGIFIIHHCKNITLIEEVLLNIMLLYDEYEEINLDKEEVKHIDNFAISINNEIIEAYDKSEENRKNLLLFNDNNDDENNEILKKDDEMENSNKIVKRIKRAIRTIEVMGHILKNHGDEIKIVHVKECFLNALNAYRRICNMCLIEFKNNKDEFIKYVANCIYNLDNSLSREEIMVSAQKYYLYYNLMAIYSTIVMSAKALGSQSLLKQIIPEIVNEIDNPFAYCVYYQCEMWYNKGLPINEAHKQYKKYPDTIKYIMRNLIKEYTDLHHIDIKTKQEIASKFDMKVNQLTFDFEK